MIHHAKKSLGQNFLKSKPALEMMISAGDVNAHDTILEIGPGKGALTEKLLEKSKKVIAIEKDIDLIAILEEKFKNEIKNNKLELIRGDILDFNPIEHGLLENTYKIIANIPYNITGAILKRFLSEVNQPSLMTLLVQKEVADRIVARPAKSGVKNNKESILSLSVKAYGTTKYMMKVSKRFFSPSPKVDSAIILIKDISRINFETEKDEKQFFEIIKTAFAHKRKVLRKNLEEITPLDNIDSMFRQIGIDPKSRAEDVPLSKWLLINKYLSKMSRKILS